MQSLLGFRVRKWPVQRNSRLFTRDQKVCGFKIQILVSPIPGNSLCQAADMHVPLSPSSII